MRLRICALLATSVCLVMLQSAPALAARSDAKALCLKEAIRSGLIAPRTNLSTVNVLAGTEENDDFSEQMTSGFDLVCGYGGHDRVAFLGGSNPTEEQGGNDIFLGGSGDDSVDFMYPGSTFNGGAGLDSVAFLEGGTFNGGDDNDSVSFVDGGTFNGGAGDDTASFLQEFDATNPSTFNGGDGNDLVDFQFGGTFNGGPGDDVVLNPFGGTFNQD